MRRFSIRPTLTLKGRTFKGLRGWSGKPLHPPLTDIPIAAYLLAAGLDVASVIGGSERAWAKEIWHAGTFVVVAGLGTSVLTAVTGLFDASRSSEAGTQARRTINTHATLMATATALAAGGLAWRLAVHGSESSTPIAFAALSVVTAAVVSLGATFGGTLVFDYGSTSRPPATRRCGIAPSATCSPATIRPPDRGAPGHYGRGSGPRSRRVSASRASASVPYAPPVTARGVRGGGGGVR